MIEVLPDTACMLYVGGMVITLFVVWIRSLNEDRNLHFHHTHLPTRCEFCGTAYVNTRVGPLSRCPDCGLINKSENSYN